MGEFWRKLRRIGRRDELADRLHEELQFHIDMKGGGVGNRGRILEEAHDVWSFGRVEQAILDLRYAARSLARSRGFFVLAAIGTALGVAAITAVVSVSDTVLVRSMPYRDSSRLVVVSDQLLKLGFPRFPLSIANFVDYRAQNHVFEDIAAFEPRALTVSGENRAERVTGMMASANLLRLLGAAPALGRWFDESENHRGHIDVAVLSHAYWQSHLDGARDVLGKSLLVNDQPYRVVGVLKPGFAFRLAGDAPEVWLPANLDPRARDSGNLSALARLKSGVSPALAQAQMHLIAADLKQRFHAGMGPHGEDGGYDAVVIPLREELYGAIRPTLYALGGASAILLLLGLANTALLWMGRAAARRKEAAVRLALGASRGRVAQQLVMEALLPSLAGGALALLLALAALSALNSAPPVELATIDGFHLDFRVFAFALLLSAMAGVVFGALPVRGVFRAGTEGRALIQDRGGIASRLESRLRHVMVAIQVGLVCGLLAPALLLMQSLSVLESVDPGVRTKNLTTGYVSVSPARALDPVPWYRRLEETLHQQLGAGNVTLASVLPLSQGGGGDPFSIEGRAFGASGTLAQFCHSMRVGEGYFELMQVKLLSGRAFEPRDFAEPTHSAIANETLAKAFWPRESPLGKRVLLGAPRPGADWMTIVGIAADIHTSQLSEAPLPQIYFPYTQSPARTMAIIVEGRHGADLAAAVRAADNAVPLYSVRSMEERVAQSVERPRLRAQLFTSYGVLAFALAGFGVYSMAVYAALRRRREFALRAALGATRRRLMMAMMSGTLGPAGIGVIAGSAGGNAIARAMNATLYGTKASNPAVYVVSALVTLGVAALATGLGGRRALDADPAEVLRGE
jgi:putative ABC transport system permease protein